jgi:hypothetical protein
MGGTMMSKEQNDEECDTRDDEQRIPIAIGTGSKK